VLWKCPEIDTSKNFDPCCGRLTTSFEGVATDGRWSPLLRDILYILTVKEVGTEWLGSFVPIRRYCKYGMVLAQTGSREGDGAVLREVRIVGASR
jgi:hypothetical protein